MGLAQGTRAWPPLDRQEPLHHLFQGAFLGWGGGSGSGSGQRRWAGGGGRGVATALRRGAATLPQWSETPPSVQHSGVREGEAGGLWAGRPRSAPPAHRHWPGARPGSPGSPEPPRAAGWRGGWAPGRAGPAARTAAGQILGSSSPGGRGEAGSVAMPFPGAPQRARNIHPINTLCLAGALVTSWGHSSLTIAPVTLEVGPLSLRGAPCTLWDTGPCPLEASSTLRPTVTTLMSPDVSGCPLGTLAPVPRRTEGPGQGGPELHQGSASRPPAGPGAPRALGR